MYDSEIDTHDMYFSIIDDWERFSIAFFWYTNNILFKIFFDQFSMFF